MTGRSPSAPRAALPIQVTDCPALPPDFGAVLDGALPSIGIVLTAGQRAAIEAHVRLLLAWTAAINLTAIREAGGVARDHVADALAAVPLLRDRLAGAWPAVLDLGSGGGYPGLPIGLVLPAGRLTLVESIAKKARFLDIAGRASVHALEAAGLPAPELSVEATRAEVLAHDAAHRSRHDVVTVRAVGSLAEVTELGLPLLRPGGLLVAWKRRGRPATHVEGDALDAEVADALPVIDVCGGALEAELPVPVPGLEDHCLLVIRAARAAPTGYPRSPTERRREQR